jgi:hypothetical protein
MQAPVGPKSRYMRAQLQIAAMRHISRNGVFCPRRCLGVAGLLDRATDWRRRAVELRRVTKRVLTQAARTSLLDRAAALEHHAENIEEMTAKFRNIRETATGTRDFIPRHNPPATRQSDDDD